MEPKVSLLAKRIRKEFGNIKLNEEVTIDGKTFLLTNTFEVVSTNRKLKEDLEKILKG